MKKPTRDKTVFWLERWTGEQWQALRQLSSWEGSLVGPGNLPLVEVAGRLRLMADEISKLQPLTIGASVRVRMERIVWMNDTTPKTGKRAKKS